MMNDKNDHIEFGAGYWSNWDIYCNNHQGDLRNRDELYRAFQKAWEAALPTFPITNDSGEVGRMEDFEIAKPPREYTNGPRPHGADGEWVENLTIGDVNDHLGRMGSLWVAASEDYGLGDVNTFMAGCEDRFLREFGETE